jgi:hypothetical protein
MIVRGSLIGTLVLTVTAVVVVPSAYGFSSALFQEAPALKKTAPSLYDGVDIELPDFDELFSRIQQVSPLARQVISGNSEQGPSGLQFIDTNDSGKYPPNHIKQFFIFFRSLTHWMCYFAHSL